MRRNFGRFIMAILVILIAQYLSEIVCNFLNINGILFICVYSIITGFALTLFYYPKSTHPLKNPYFYREWCLTFIIIFVLEILFS